MFERWANSCFFVSLDVDFWRIHWFCIHCVYPLLLGSSEQHSSSCLISYLLHECLVPVAYFSSGCPGPSAPDTDLIDRLLSQYDCCCCDFFHAWSRWVTLRAQLDICHALTRNQTPASQNQQSCPLHRQKHWTVSVTSKNEKWNH